MYDENPNPYNMFEEVETDQMFRQAEAAREQRVAIYIAKVMGWMCVGLLTTLASMLVCLAVPSLNYALRGSSIMYAVIIAQLVVVLAMSFGANRVGPTTATVMFMAYSALTGVTFTTLFFLFQAASLLGIFALTAFIFVSMSVYGFVTKRDLTRVGTLALFGLLGIILGGLANFLLGSSMLDFAITTIGIVIFIALTAYDTQKIKGFYMDAVAQGHDEDGPVLRKLAIFGALTLYLDFINLFLKLLRLLGRRRN